MRVRPTLILLLTIMLLAAPLSPHPAIAQETDPTDEQSETTLQPLPRGDIRLVLREDFLLEQLETQILPNIQGISAGDIYIEDPNIDLRPDNIIEVSATTELTMAGTPLVLRPTIALRLEAADNQITIEIATVSLEGISLPAALLTSQIAPIQAMAEEQINQALELMARLLEVELVHIEVTEDLIAFDFDFNLRFFRTGPDALSADENAGEEADDGADDEGEETESGG